jgi:tRNA splicing endonuclease
MHSSQGIAVTGIVADVRLERARSRVLDPTAAQWLHDVGWYGAQSQPPRDAGDTMAEPDRGNAETTKWQHQGRQRRRRRQQDWEAWELTLEETVYQHTRGAVRVIDLDSVDTGDTGDGGDGRECRTLLDPSALWRACCVEHAHMPATYAVYTHWRRLGWIPRAGLQYGVTFLLYRGGDCADGEEPQHQHAECASLSPPARPFCPNDALDTTPCPHDP